jgi:hypothetical protein
MAQSICRERDAGNKQVQAGTGMPKLTESEELRTQRMPSPNKLHHFSRPRRDTVSFRNAVAVFLTAIGNPDETSLASTYRSEGCAHAGRHLLSGKRHGVSPRSANMLQLASVARSSPAWTSLRVRTQYLFSATYLCLTRTSAYTSANRL